MNRFADVGTICFQIQQIVDDVHRRGAQTEYCGRYQTCRNSDWLARAMRLRRDLGVNLAGALLACDLLERIDELEARLRLYER